MLPDDDRPFLLTWRKTFPHSENDFTGTHADHPNAFARMYFQPSHPDPERRWFWTATGDAQLGLGNEPTAREAARKAEAAFQRWRIAL
jgi:hypothetical protein